MLNLVGGVIADRFDPKRLIGTTQLISACVAVLLGFLIVTGELEPWHILAVAFMIGGVQGFDEPARQSLFSHLVPREDLMNAIALNSIVWQSTRVIGPSIAGVLIARADASVVLFLSAGGVVVLRLCQ